MKKKKPTYQELEARLAEAEQIMEVLRTGQADVVISRDHILILRLKEAEQALREREAQLAAILEQMPVGVGVLDHEGQLILSNTLMDNYVSQRIVPSGEGEQAALSQAIDGQGRLLPPEQWPGDRALYGETVSPGVEFLYTGEEGQELWLNVSAVPFQFGKGGGTGAIVVAQDITTHKQDKQALQALTERLEERVAERTAVLETQREQLRALSARLAEVQETERRALARELHDRVGQNLTGLDFNLQALKTKLGVSDPEQEPLLGVLDHSLELVAQTSSLIRDILSELRPPMLDDYGLVDTLNWYAERQAQLWKLSITVTGETLEPRLPAAKEIALFRIVQEALTNVAKHADASRVLISVEPAPETVCLVIADDGRGFASIGSKPASWGLRVMKERAEMAGGTCWVESSPNSGTRVVVEMPRR